MVFSWDSECPFTVDMLIYESLGLNELIHGDRKMFTFGDDIEPVSAFSPANNPGRANENPIWWRWHGNTKSHAILPSADV